MIHTITCPACQRSLRVPDELLGHLVKCPSCGHTFDAPEEPEEPATARRLAPAAREEEEDERPRRRRPARRDYDDDDDDYDEDDRPRGRRRRRYEDHRGSLIQILGILSFFVVPLVLGPIAWILGSNDLAEMRAGRMDPAGRSATESGRLCGMISTILYGVVVLGCCSFYAFMAAVGTAAMR